MGKFSAVCVAVFCLILFRMTHIQILSGHISAGGKRNRREVVLGDPGFWSTAALGYVLATVFLLISATYFFTGYRYLPELDRYDVKQNVIIFFLLAAIIFPCAFLLEFILPSIYS